MNDLLILFRQATCSISYQVSVRLYRPCFKEKKNLKEAEKLEIKLSSVGPCTRHIVHFTLVCVLACASISGTSMLSDR